MFRVAALLASVLMALPAFASPRRRHPPARRHATAHRRHHRSRRQRHKKGKTAQAAPAAAPAPEANVRHPITHSVASPEDETDPIR